MSIPQANDSVQTLAIKELATYSSLADAFVVIAPSVEHADTNDTCDVLSYQDRCWCRAEQVCHCMRMGYGNMWVANELECSRITEDWFSEGTLRVFEGELTCCRRKHKGMEKCDRQSLVLPILGLYAEMYSSGAETFDLTSSQSGDWGMMFRKLYQDRATILPASFEMEKELEDGTIKVVTIELFGTLIQEVEDRINQSDALKEKLRLRRCETVDPQHSLIRTNSNRLVDVPLPRSLLHGGVEMTVLNPVNPVIGDDLRPHKDMIISRSAGSAAPHDHDQDVDPSTEPPG